MRKNKARSEYSLKEEKKNLVPLEICTELGCHPPAVVVTVLGLKSKTKA